MPTAKDRVQVLLEPEEYAELKMLCKEERRSAAAMAAVLITEAIKARVRAGTFTPNADDPAYEAAMRRQVARQTGRSVQEQEKDQLQEFLDEHATVVTKKASKIEGLPSAKELKVKT